MTPNTVALLLGLVLPVLVGVFGTVVGLDRDRAYYPTITVVVASYYCLFGAMGAPTETVLLEVLAAAPFVVAAAVGFRKSLWIVVVALAAHGILDVGHDAVIANPGVPPWWPAFCGAFDVVAAVYLAGLIKSGRTRVSP
ncbi:MAG: hypothetical protein SFV24_21020 [Gemmatimonadales bacterium]|nr:hypothetical protein [Gemmatimonadales bacterium]